MICFISKLLIIINFKATCLKKINKYALWKTQGYRKGQLKGSWPGLFYLK